MCHRMYSTVYVKKCGLERERELMEKGKSILVYSMSMFFHLERSANRGESVCDDL